MAQSLAPAVTIALHAALVMPHAAATAVGGDARAAAKERLSVTPPPGTPDADMGAGTAPAAVKSSDGNTAVLPAAARAVADQKGGSGAKVS